MMNAKRPLITIFTGALLSIVLLWGVCQYRQWSQYRQGVASAEAGNFIASLSAMEASIRMYTPLSPLTDQAALRIWAMAESAEKTGDRELALTTYRALRSSFYAVRWIFQPGASWIERSDARIAALLGQTGGNR